MIYLASPYSHPSLAMRRHRFDLVCAKAAQIIASGRLVFSPIAHSHPIVESGCEALGGGWETWAAFDRWFIERCDELWVLTLDGWKDSAGINVELEIADSLDKPVRFISYLEPINADPE